MRSQKSEAQKAKHDQKAKRIQKWDARVLLTGDLKHLNPHDELYQITWSKKSKDVIFENWGASFSYPKILEFLTFFEKSPNMRMKVMKLFLAQGVSFWTSCAINNFLFYNAPVGRSVL